MGLYSWKWMLVIAKEEGNIVLEQAEFMVVVEFTRDSELNILAEVAGGELWVPGIRARLYRLNWNFLVQEKGRNSKMEKIGVQEKICYMSPFTSPRRYSSITKRLKREFRRPWEAFSLNKRDSNSKYLDTGDVVKTHLFCETFFSNYTGLWNDLYKCVYVYMWTCIYAHLLMMYIFSMSYQV